jgi:hypothetical protein
VYEGNALAVPLYWGTTGTIGQDVAGKYIAKLYYTSPSGVAYVLDDRGVLTKSGIAAVERAIERRIVAPYYEEEEGDPHEGRSASEAAAAQRRIKQAEKLRVRITPIVSPTTGKRGLRLVFSPPFAELHRNSSRRSSRRRDHTALSQSDLDRAEAIGAQGFYDGERAPSQSAALHNLMFVEHRGLGLSDLNQLMIAYTRGWQGEQRKVADATLREIPFPPSRAKIRRNSRRRTSRRR